LALEFNKTLAAANPDIPTPRIPTILFL